MATGIALPFKGISGAVATVSGSAQLQKLIIVRLSDCDSANPFQDLGIGADVIFGIDSEESRNVLRLRILEVFKHFEQAGRAKLMGGYPVFAFNSSTQELQADIKYINLEIAQPEEFHLAYTTFGAKPIL